MLWRIYFPGDFKNRINIHLPGMASVWYCLNKTGHSTLPASELKNSKQIPTCSDLGTKSLPKLPEPSRGEAVSVKQRDFAENDSRLCYDPPPPPPRGVFSVLYRKSTSGFILRGWRLNIEAVL